MSWLISKEKGTSDEGSMVDYDRHLKIEPCWRQRALHVANQTPEVNSSGKRASPLGTEQMATSWHGEGRRGTNPGTRLIHLGNLRPTEYP